MRNEVKSGESVCCAVSVTKMIGGGDSWYYAIDKTGKVLGAAHEDDRPAMNRLHAIKEKHNVEAHGRAVARTVQPFVGGSA